VGTHDAQLAATVSGSANAWIHAYGTLEDLALRWLAELLGLPSTYQGVFTGGGSTANLLGLGAARQYAAERLGVDPARDGVAGLPQPCIYASKEPLDRHKYSNISHQGLLP
jgi:glutamate/tyrosine decarboxylase-like PLP-dependent enzyme